MSSKTLKQKPEATSSPEATSQLAKRHHPPSRASYALWGSTFYFLSATIEFYVPLLWVEDSGLSASKAFALGSVAEWVFSAFAYPLAWRRWNLSSGWEWAAFLFTSLTASLYFVPMIVCSRLMPIGDFSAIRVACICLAPLVASVMLRRCPDPVVLFLLLLVQVGVVLIFRPSFIFGGVDGVESGAVSLVGFFLSLVVGVHEMYLPFVFGHFSRVHWSCFVVLKPLVGLVVAVVYVAIDGADFSLAPGVAWAPRVAATLVGPLTILNRVAQVIGSQELESLGTGVAGLIGNVVDTSGVPTSVIFAFLIFGQTPVTLDIVGFVIVVVCVILITLREYFSPRTSKDGKGEEEEEEEVGKEEEDDKKD